MDELRVLVFPPGRRDGEVTRALLEASGLNCFVSYDAISLARELEIGAGAIVMTDVGVVSAGFHEVQAALGRQPPWSDIPIVLLCQTGSQSPIAAQAIQSLTNVTLLDRPTSARSLVSAVLAAIRGRMRQYQTREQLQALRDAQASLSERERELSKADQRKDEFLAMLAHELRNPLAPIRNASELLGRMLPAGAQSQNLVSLVKRQVTHLTRLVDDLLDVSRITQGRIELQRRPIDLATVIQQALESVDPLMREKRHRVTVLGSATKVTVDGDSARLVQCVANILTNAAKYTDVGGVVNVEYGCEGGLAMVRVTDNGVGIPAELLPQIFELFVQSDRTLDRSDGGLGIGLSVVRRLVDMHGGTVSAHSDGPGHGATFIIRLPIAASPIMRLNEATAGKVDSKRILIVDDNVDAANSLALLLQMEGHTTRSVYDPGEALESIDTFQPQVVLLDIGLPGMDGYEVARRMRADEHAVRIIALTGYGRREDQVRAREAGFDGHLVKPVDLQVLREQIR